MKDIDDLTLFSFFFPYRFPSTRSTFTSDPWSWRHVDFEGHRFSAEPRRPPAFEPRVFLDRLLSNCWLRMDTSNILSSFLKAQGPYDNIAVMVAWFGTARQPGRNGLWHNWRQLRRNWRRLVMCRVVVLDVHGILNLRTSSKISSGLFEVHYRLCIFFVWILSNHQKITSMIGSMVATSGGNSWCLGVDPIIARWGLGFHRIHYLFLIGEIRSGGGGCWGGWISLVV